MSKRLKPQARKQEILTAAVAIAADKGYANVTRDDIAARIGVTGTAVQYHFSTMGQLRVAMMRHAVKTENLAVIAQGLAAKDVHAAKASAPLKKAAIKHLTA